MPSVTLSYHRRVVLSVITAFVLVTIVAGILLNRFGMLHIGMPAPAPSTAANLETPSSTFAGEEEGVVIDLPNEEHVILPVQKVLFGYGEIKGSCDPNWEGGPCVNVRSGPGTDFPKVAQLRNNVILKVGGKVIRDGTTWFKIVFDEWLRYPERVTGDWYVHADYIDVLYDEGNKDLHIATSSNKYIVVDRSDQVLYAYNELTIEHIFTISTGNELNPTPEGAFTIYKKTPSRYMQGPLPDAAPDDYYDLPGVPWNLYFTMEGAVIHGAYWHQNFGTPYSHGCVNLAPNDAKILYEWADVGTLVIVKE